LWQNSGARTQQNEALFVINGTRADKCLVQFSIWNRGTKNLNSIYDLLEKYVQKRNFLNFCENGALKKNFIFQ